MNVNLHIGRLVLEGLPGASIGAAQIDAALTAELSRLMSGALPVMFHTGVMVPELRGNPKRSTGRPSAYCCTQSARQFLVQDNPTPG